jgi:hypothetical protein
MKKKKYHYVYRITNKIEKKHYIGVRSCNIDPYLDLGKEYKGTSLDSDFLKDQNENPQNYIYQILNFFENRKDAIKREMYLHEIYKVDLNESFYNIRKQGSTKWDNAGNKKIAKKISIANKGRIVINNGEVKKHIKPEEFEHYLQDGWIKGGVSPSPEVILKMSISNSDTIYMNNNIIEIRLEQNEIDEYRILGFTEGRLPMKDIQKFQLFLSHTGKTLTGEHKENIGIGGKGIKKSEQMKMKLSETRTGMIYINNGEKEKIIQPYDLQTYIYDGWEEGKLPMPDSHKQAISEASFGKPGTTTGKISVVKNNIVKYISQSELDNYLSDGWVQGGKKFSQETKEKLKGRKGSTAGRIGINNNIKNKYINADELDKYLKEGWVKGLKSKKKVTNG